MRSLKKLCLLAIPLIGVGGAISVTADGGAGPCHAACTACARTHNANGAAQCQVEVFWDEANGRAGCCIDETKNPPCPDLTCLWAGILSIKNASQGNMDITIHGPGNATTCTGVTPGSYCTKTFGGGGNGDITAPCGQLATVLVDTTTAGGNQCQLSAVFTCAGCPGPG